MRLEERRRRVRQLHAEGLTLREIGRVCGISKDTACRDLRALGVDGAPVPAPIEELGRVEDDRTTETASHGGPGASADDLDSMAGVRAALASLYADLRAGVVDRGAPLRLRILSQRLASMEREASASDCSEHLTLDTAREWIERVNAEWMFHVRQIVHDLHQVGVGREVSGRIIRARVGLVSAALERGGDDGK